MMRVVRVSWGGVSPEAEGVVAKLFFCRRGLRSNRLKLRGVISADPADLLHWCC